MKKLLFAVSTTYFCCCHLCTTRIAQYDPSHKSGLPEGAIARLGKGYIRGITYSPDNTQLLSVHTTVFGFTMQALEKNSIC